MQLQIKDQTVHDENNPYTKRKIKQESIDIKTLAKSLFDSLLKHQQLKSIVSLNKSTMIELLSKSGSYFHRNIAKHYKKTLIFLANYHKLLNIYSLKNQTPITNEMALHFILLLGYLRLKDNKINEAKNVFKNVWKYTEIKNCSKVMLCIALNNLGFLHLKNHKPFKSLECSLKCIELMGQHMHGLKKQNLKSQLVQDSVILINSLIQCRKSLKKIIQMTRKPFYYDLYQEINQIGYKCSRKYLGEQSQFTKVFESCEDYGTNGGLPMYLDETEEVSVVQRSTLQQKILNQLQGIYDVLKTKRDPQIVYVNHPQVIQPPANRPPSPQTQPQPESESQSTIIFAPEVAIVQTSEKKPAEEQMQASQAANATINGWTVHAYMIRPKSVAQRMAKYIFSEFSLGSLVIQYAKKRKQFKEILSSERLQKVLTLINFECGILYDFVIKKINDEEFFNIFIFSHIEIDDDGHLEFLIQKKPIISAFEVQFFQTKSLIFINHILGNTFRVNIRPVDSSLVLHISIQLRPITFTKLFQIRQTLPEFIHSIYEKIKEFQYQKQIQIPDLPDLRRFEVTQIKVMDDSSFEKLIIDFLKDFQGFLLEVEQQDKGDFKLEDFLNNNEQDLASFTLISFVEGRENSKKSNKTKNQQKNQQITKLQGRFNIGKYLSNIQSVQLFCQNNFTTFDLESSSFAKGTTMIYGDKFEAQFGVPFSFFESQEMIQSVLEIIVKKYELRTFFSPLKTHDEELYNQNAIYQLPIFCKSFKRITVKDQNDYYIPMTISHLTVNNEIPLAFRVDAYFPCEGPFEYSILIKIQPSFWEKPIAQPQLVKPQEQKINESEEQNEKQNLHFLQADYGFKKDYFLIEWCQIQGYQNLMKCFLIKGMKILTKGSCLRYFPLQRFLQYAR